MKNKTRFIVAGLLTATMLVAPVVGIAQEKEKPKTPAAGDAAPKPTPATRAVPFRGTVAAVNKEAKTVTVGERVFHIDADTKVVKNGNEPATLAEIKVGDAIAGNYTKADDGKLTAKMIRFGVKPPPAEQKDKKAKATDKVAE